jgi:hypothetical protein
MAIMAHYFIFIHMNVQKFKPKYSFDEIFNLIFDLRPLKMNINASNRSRFWKELSKGLI